MFFSMALGSFSWALFLGSKVLTEAKPPSFPRPSNCLDISGAKKLWRLRLPAQTAQLSKSCQMGIEELTDKAWRSQDIKRYLRRTWICFASSFYLLYGDLSHDVYPAPNSWCGKNSPILVAMATAPRLATFGDNPSSTLQGNMPNSLIHISFSSRNIRLKISFQLSKLHRTGI